MNKNTPVFLQSDYGGVMFDIMVIKTKIIFFCMGY